MNSSKWQIVTKNIFKPYISVQIYDKLDYMVKNTDGFDHDMAKKFHYKFHFRNIIYFKIISFCFEFQITSRTEPRCRFALFSKDYSKTFRTLPKFIIHKFAKFHTNTNISKNNEVNRKPKRILSSSTLFRLFSSLSIIMTVPRCTIYD